MILPDKHVTVTNSLLNTGAVILTQLKNKKTVTALWSETKLKEEIRTFERFTLALDFLYLIGAVDFKDGYLRRIK